MIFIFFHLRSPFTNPHGFSGAFVRIAIPVFTNDELVNFAKVYTMENGFRIDQMGMLALYNLIGINQKEDQPMNIGAVKDIIDSAIAKSRGGLRKLISKKKVNESCDRQNTS